jgi:sugar-specific transcriptional regulator TrmB
MSDQTDNLLNLVKPYGLSDAEGSIYLYLLRHGFASALQISKELKMGRTRVYRLLDKLEKKQLVEFKVDERGMKFGATSTQKFQQLVVEKEQEVEGLKRLLPELLNQLGQIPQPAAKKSKVLYYEGIRGLKQVSFNITRAEKLLRVFEMEHLNYFLPVKFSEEVREKLVKNKVRTHDLTNKTSFEGFTDVREMIELYSEFRYIDPKKLRINFEVLIYNDVYATYTYKQDKIFCIEVYNEQLAEMQKQLFDYIWDQAEKMRFLDERGAAELKK